MAAPAQPERKKVLRVLFISLLLDLISFTFILPLFPQLLEFYRNLEVPTTAHTPTLLSTILAALNTYKNAFARPINSRYDIVLLGGALGSLFSLCQAIASPIIGSLSDRHGRRTALLWSMVGNIASVALWCAATDFRTFLASRVVGGLSEGNVQLAMAIATDISTEEERGRTMAMVGACFSIAFTFGPALGAALSRVTTVAANPFATAAGFSLFLVVTETVYLYFCLPETHTPTTRDKSGSEGRKNLGNETIKVGGEERTNSHTLLNLTHFTFILFFSGMEFSLPFMTYDLFAYESAQSGRLLGFIGLIASIMQGGVVRRMHPLRVVHMGVLACAAAFFLLGKLSTERGLYVAASLLAVTSATVVTGLNSLSSFEASWAERGEKLGNHRSFGQVGRALGPLIFCSLYWWAGRDVAYMVGGAGMVGVVGLVFGGLKSPKGLQVGKKKVVVNGGVDGKKSS
ncbi:MFS general substrate transporter [Teratosphaeria nubilosa]|uniref:MFS general substrate transporter n=1 Tax=Teratosphaeria nubilosa TaxID=161662 RepID=A0A6G1KW15_9PEZI|nr:MFS general substrate transporter [Teratosphaeria nubilosa]